MREGGGDGLFGGKLWGKRPGSLPGWRVVLPERRAILTRPLVPLFRDLGAFGKGANGQLSA